MITKKSLDFFKKNMTLKWSMPAAPTDVKSDFEIADWLLNRSNFGWLELDIEFDLKNWKEEYLKSQRYLVTHRENDSNGWRSCCIHGIAVEKTGAWTHYGYSSEKDVPYHWTEVSNLTPGIKSFFTEFPYEKYRRIRFMELLPGGSISPHSDAPGRLPGENNLDMLDFGVPVNIAINHPDKCHMSLDGYGQIPWQEGKAFIINIRNYHSVINFSNKNRIHLIAHGIPGNRKNEFVELIARSYRKQYEKGN
jgi:hypothetical protein